MNELQIVKATVTRGVSSDEEYNVPTINICFGGSTLEHEFTKRDFLVCLQLITHRRARLDHMCHATPTETP